MTSRPALLLLSTILAASAAGACHGGNPLPVSSAPLSACLTFLLQDDRPLENAYDRDVQNAVRKAIATAMTAAGFNVHFDPSLPHDLLARITTAPGSRLESGAQVQVKLALSNQGRAVEQLEVSAERGAPSFDGIVADQIVDGLFRSQPLAAFTRELRKPEGKQHLAGGALREALTPACQQGPAPAASSAPGKPEPPVAPAAPEPPKTVSFVSGEPAPNAYAFIVGIDEYASAPRAAGGKADAERFAEVARRTLGVPDGHIKLVVGDKADRLAFDLTVEWLKLNVPKGGRVYFYFSGHGALRRQTMQAFLLPRDGDPKALDKTAIPLGGFLQALGQTKAGSVVAIVDAGFSGSGPRSAPLPEGAPPRTLSDPEIPARVALLSAVTSAEAAGVSVSVGGGGLGGGRFTRYVVDGLGSGRADIDGDGQISLQELLAWAGPRVSREAKRGKAVQTPSVLVGPSVGAAQVTLVSGLPEQ